MYISTATTTQAHINDYYADAGIYVYDRSEHIKLTIVPITSVIYKL